MKPQKNIPLIVGILLPILFILVLSLVIFIPKTHLKPQYNFIYSITDPDQPYLAPATVYPPHYTVSNNHIFLESTVTGTATNTSVTNAPTLYMYNMTDNSIHQIDFNTAKSLTLDPGPSSPDGYIVTYQDGGESIFNIFGSEDTQNGYVIAKGNATKNLDGLGSTIYSYRPDNLTFIGWVK